MTTKGGYKIQAQLFRALAHPVRLRILDVLARQEAWVCRLAALIGKRQPYVSQQVATLREAGLASDRRDDKARVNARAQSQAATGSALAASARIKPAIAIFLLLLLAALIAGTLGIDLLRNACAQITLPVTGAGE